jgi:toxin-antitoxin system PIN domain toxin
MSLLVFPDLNVWLALTLTAHEHHEVAWSWYRALNRGEQLAFCRFTQIGLLRLLTNRTVARDEVLNQSKAWQVYDRWIQRGGAVFQDEPYGLEVEFRSFADRTTPSPQEWADSYLAAFAAAAFLELVTLDRALSRRARRSILLRSAG